MSLSPLSLLARGREGGRERSTGREGGRERSTGREGGREGGRETCREGGREGGGNQMEAYKNFRK